MPLKITLASVGLLCSLNIPPPQVEAELPLVGGPVHVLYKQYRPRSWWKSFCSMFRRSRARRAWHLARALLARQVATAQPLAVCEADAEALGAAEDSRAVAAWCSMGMRDLQGGMKPAWESVTGGLATFAAP